MADNHSNYYVPHHAYWSLLGSFGLMAFLAGFANLLHNKWFAPHMMFLGAAILLIMTVGWFREVINESISGKYNKQVDLSYRWGMAWFIFSEVCFFAAFFGALFYARVLVVPFMGGDGNPLTHYLLWPNFEATWPLLVNPDNTIFTGANEVMGAWGLPALNTFILLTSGLTITWAHWGLAKGNRKQLNIGLLLTVLLGMLFLVMQAVEYHEAYTHMNLTLSSGIYGATFFMLTGFHGMHVTLGTIMLMVILARCLAGHFSCLLYTSPSPRDS